MIEDFEKSEIVLNKAEQMLTALMKKETTISKHVVLRRKTRYKAILYRQTYVYSMIALQKILSRNQRICYLEKAIRAYKKTEMPELQEIRAIKISLKIPRNIFADSVLENTSLNILSEYYIDPKRHCFRYEFACGMLKSERRKMENSNNKLCNLQNWLNHPRRRRKTRKENEKIGPKKLMDHLLILIEQLNQTTSEDKKGQAKLITRSISILNRIDEIMQSVQSSQYTSSSKPKPEMLELVQIVPNHISAKLEFLPQTYLPVEFLYKNSTLTDTLTLAKICLVFVDGCRGIAALQQQHVDIDEKMFRLFNLICLIIRTLHDLGRVEKTVEVLKCIITMEENPSSSNKIEKYIRNTIDTKPNNSFIEVMKMLKYQLSLRLYKVSLYYEDKQNYKEALYFAKHALKWHKSIPNLTIDKRFRRENDHMETWLLERQVEVLQQKQNSLPQRDDPDTFNENKKDSDSIDGNSF